MKTIGNILWFIFGGLLLSLSWALAGVMLCVTIIGIPAGKQCFKIARLALFPFGKEIKRNGKTGSFILNLLWILIFGWELALEAAVAGILMCVTVVGIPFGKQAFKIAALSFMPFGASID